MQNEQSWQDLINNLTIDEKQVYLKRMNDESYQGMDIHFWIYKDESLKTETDPVGPVTVHGQVPAIGSFVYIRSATKGYSCGRFKVVRTDYSIMEGSRKDQLLRNNSYRSEVHLCPAE